MSSVQSAFASIDKPPTKFAALLTPSYEDTSLVTGQMIEMPIPFTVVNQVLDINVNQSSVIQTIVNDGTQPVRRTNIQGKAFGGASLVKSLGTNMRTYLRNWIGVIETLGAGVAYTGPLVLYIQPFMTKIQLAIPSFAINTDVGVVGGPFQRDSSWGITTEAPVSTEYTGGGTNDNFFTTWIFKTPMTIQYETAGGGFKYITMTSQFAEE
jgi:hypothetical protein